MKEATIVIRVPLREGYPWKPTQKLAEEALRNGAVDGIRWLDCVGGLIDVQVEIKERQP